VTREQGLIKVELQVSAEGGYLACTQKAWPEPDTGRGATGGYLGFSASNGHSGGADSFRVSRFLLSDVVAEKAASHRVVLEAGARDWGQFTEESQSAYWGLTQQVVGSRGQLWDPVRVSTASWVVSFQAQVVGLPGEGMGFWYSDSPHRGGEVLGHGRLFKGLMLSMITTEEGHPDNSVLIEAWRNDGDVPVEADFLETKAGRISGCRAKLSYKGAVLKLRLWYEKEKLTLEVELRNEKGYIKCFQIGGIFLPRGLHMGFSAANGGHGKARYSIQHYKMRDLVQLRREEYELRVAAGGEIPPPSPWSPR